MADLTITAASCLPTGTNTRQTVQFGESVTAGQVVYLSSSDSKYYKADSDAGSATTAAGAGIALCTAATNQYGAILTNGTITIGGTMTQGKAYYVSNTAGGICPESDLGSGDYVSLIGFATSTTVLSVDFKNTGITI